MNLDFLKTFWSKIKLLVSGIRITKKLIIILAPIVLLIILVISGVLIFSFRGLSDKDIAEKAVKYISDNYSPATLVEFSRESGLIKIKINVGGQEYDSYATKDGKLLFPQALDMSGQESASPETNPQAQQPVTKSDQPLLEAFVVSMCPFGLQMQRMIADAISSVPALSQYVKVKYIGSVSGDGKTITAMHGEEEAKENLRQICIREEQPAKYWGYLACYMKAGDASGCQTTAGVNSSTLNSCISNPGKGVAYAQEDFEASSNYDVSGSPTLALNGSIVSEFDYGGRTSNAVRSVVCAGFNSPAGFCSGADLNTATVATGFSPSYEAQGGSANNSASCN